MHGKAAYQNYTDVRILEEADWQLKLYSRMGIMTISLRNDDIIFDSIMEKIGGSPPTFRRLIPHEECINTIGASSTFIYSALKMFLQL